MANFRKQTILTLFIQNFLISVTLSSYIKKNGFPFTINQESGLTFFFAPRKFQLFLSKFYTSIY